MSVAVAPPMALIAEITHRCPLSCPYCSNPLELIRRGAELAAAEWARLLREAASLGVLHVHLTGGEPLARRDLEALVAEAAGAGLYVNLITSGIGLDEARLARLIEAGLDHVQLSFQDADPGPADRVGGRAGAHADKLAAAARVVAAGLPLTANFVVHRRNLDRVGDMLSLGEALGARRIEIAHVQHHGWALANRAALMPTADQVAHAVAVVAVARARLAGRIVVDHVAPDYHAARPKPCMGGWAQRLMLVTPDGRAAPCHAASGLPGLHLPSVRDHSLDWIWRDSEAFNRYRPPAFAPAACQGCPGLAIDFGGCRCQAFALAADAAAADPVCELSPDHAVVVAARRIVADASSVARGFAAHR